MRKSRMTRKATSNHYEINEEKQKQQEELNSFLSDITSTNDFFAPSSQFPNFESIGIQSPTLLKRIHSMLYENENNDNNDHDNNDHDHDNTEMDRTPKPSAIQAASYKAIMSNNDITIGAETGSGKTLAYLLPIIDDILQTKAKVKSKSNSEGDMMESDFDNNYIYARAVILVPNKELANQVIRMAMPLCGGVWFDGWLVG